MAKRGGEYRYNDDELAGIIQNQLGDCEGGYNDELDGNRERALDYYYGRDSINPPAAGGSSVHSMDVSDMVNSNLAMLAQMFGTDQAVMFEANGQDDEEQAEAESQAVNNVIMEQNNGYITLMMTGAKDALLQKNGWCMIEVHDHITTETRDLAGISEDGMAIYLNDSTAVDVREQVSDTKVKHTFTKRKFNIRPLQPEHVMWWRNWHDMNLQDIPFIAVLAHKSRSELIAAGYDRKTIEELPNTSTDTKYADHARNQNNNPNWYAWTPDQERITIYECWMLIDMDEDGISERWKITIAGNDLHPHKILDKEQVDYVPLATGTPFIQPHRINGESVFDRLKSVQDSKTSTLRMWHDNHFAAVHNRVAVVETAVNLNDALDGRPGGVVRVTSPDAVFPFPFTDVGPSCQMLMEYQDKVRTERGGASLEMQTSQGQVIGETYSGIERQYTAKELLVQMIAKNLAETLIKYTFLIMHQCLRRYSLEPIMFKHAGQWVETDPRTWQPRHALNVKVGLTPGQRNAANAALGQLIQMQAQAAQPGSPFNGTLVDHNSLHKTITTWLEGNAIDNPEAYLVDPNSEQAAKAAQQNQQAQQMAMQREQAEIARQDALDRYKIDEELKFKYFNTVVDAEVEEAKIVGHATTELQKLGIQGDQQDEQADRQSIENTRDRASDESITDRVN